MILYLLVAVLVLIYLWFKSKFSYWKNHGIDHVPATSLFGSFNFLAMKEHSSLIMKKIYDQHKGKTPILGLYFFTQPTMILLEPEVIKDIFTRNFETFNDRGFYINEKDDPLSHNMSFVGGQKWKDLRTKLNPTFTSGKIKSMYGIVVKECEKMNDFLEPLADDTTVVEFQDVLSALTTQIIASVAFGLEIECLGKPDNRFRKIAHEIFNPSGLDLIKLMFTNSFPGISKRMGLTVNSKDTIKFFLDLIKDTVRYRETNNVQRNDFLQTLMEIRNSEQGMSIEEITANSFLFFLAGFDTSSKAAMYALYELALNQEMQERLRCEIHEVIQNFNDALTYDSIFEMKYLDMIFKETLRKYPVIDSQMRQSSKDYQVPGSKLVIPAGTSIFVPITSLHHDERFYDNPSKFDPERFTPENEKKIPSYAYLPFSEGPRICIGKRFGIMQTKLALISLLLKFEILPCEKTLIPMKFSTTATFQTPDGGMWLKLKKL